MTSTSVKRKAPDTDTSSASKTPPPVASFTSRNPPWTYLKLQLIHQPGTSTTVQSQPLDPLTVRTYLTSALSQFLGLAGSAISIDILQISPETSQRKKPNSTNKIVWIRVPCEDASAVVAALSSWIGGNPGGGVVGSVAWKVCAKGNFLGALIQGPGDDLFVP
ncbi:hypothetical protein EYZ11_003243 [Aspergillus tanneri]|uniref:Ribonucleases P/MRP subunit Pop8-like domain-containing protein n=1 Tax=Aspergillus tanneri TaxID=1220188 RepID=A0A4S3JP06_9EURO|nr:uncharacterized protein ATNIH1004_006316 [Aspergillus tanneri]KAA8647622.1 hypothetical protein ATNIH1004_006316 [Aspergillus tanneri]THC97295.1 hypothetical protein EYZ11_003243 [Aspergillus tanneri]